MAPGPETAAVWQQKLISPLCCHRPTLVSRSKQWPACSSYRAWPPAFLTGGPPYNQENVNPHTESFCTMCCSVTAREEAKKTTPTAGPTAKHTFLTKRAYSAERRHTGRLPPLLGEPAQTAKACNSNKINSSHKGFILEHNKILYTFSHKSHNLIFGRLLESHRSSS